MKTVGIIIQARMTSTRFPGKVLAPLNGIPMLQFQLERLRSCRLVEKIVVATSVDPTDQGIEDLCRKMGAQCSRGNLDDVLDRYYQAAKENRIQVVVRITGDCPVIDPEVVDKVIGEFLSGDFDYVANTAPSEGSTYPDGMDVEVMSISSLEKAWKEAKKPSEREHVTFYLWQNPKIFRTKRVDLPTNLSRIRLTVDYPQDLEVIRNLVEAHSSDLNKLTMNRMIEWLDSHQDVREKNSNIVRNSGWASAFAKDQKRELK